MSWAAIVIGGTTLAYGIYKGEKASSKLSELHKQPLAQYNETPEMKAARERANNMAKGGFTPEEKVNYQQQLARSQNTAYRRAVDSAPGQSQALLGATNYVNVAAQNDFASRDAAQHRSNIQYADKFAQYLQELNNQNIDTQIKHRLLAEQALGQAAADGMNQTQQGTTQLGIGATELFGNNRTTGVNDMTGVGGNIGVQPDNPNTAIDDYYLKQKLKRGWNY